MHGNRGIVFVLLACFLTLNPTRTASAIGWIGMTVEPPRGVQVGEIIKHGPADKAGLVRGDIIRKVDGQEIVTMEQFILSIRGSRPGTVLTLGILRNGQELEIKANLEDGAEHQSVAQAPIDRMLPGFGDMGLAPPMRDFSNQTPPSADWSTAYPRFSRDLPPDLSPPTTWLGIAPTMAQGGVGVHAVAPGSPGEKAGLKPRDVIVSINGQALATPQALVRLLATFKPGDVVEINLNRDSQAQTVQAMLTAPPTNPPTHPATGSDARPTPSSPANPAPSSLANP
ncbi:MAG: PDZ/DHR/GLGF domain protein [Magnetococcales bacterium]|nr:PDZ/DHR/GLGF domain protein [Magnetococcales bacterium]HIJ83020.1 PDZ domain-containing protein [Magnetococcales bacterium]